MKAARASSRKASKDSASKPVGAIKAVGVVVTEISGVLTALVSHRSNDGTLAEGTATVALDRAGFPSGRSMTVALSPEQTKALAPHLLRRLTVTFTVPS